MGGSGSDRSARLRGFFARFVALKGGVDDPTIEQAFAAIPRETFAGPGPWQIKVPGGRYLETPDSDPAYLYHDWLVALDAERGINIGEPALHARCLAALAVAKGETILHVGDGAGYYTAILAHLTGAGGQVHAYEIDGALAGRARDNLAEVAGVRVHERSGIGDGLPRADAIYVNASATHPSRSWLDALRPGGRLLFPLHATGEFGGMLMVIRAADAVRWPARFVSPAGFIPCQGGQDTAVGRRLAEAFARRDWHDVRSLRLDTAPDDTCWVAGDGWWLSTEAIG